VTTALLYTVSYTRTSAHMRATRPWAHNMSTVSAFTRHEAKLAKKSRRKRAESPPHHRPLTTLTVTSKVDAAASE
jgi:hypothetical protein